MTGEPRLVLVRSWLRPAGDLGLGLDLGGGERIHEILDPERPPADLQGSILICDRATACVGGEGGTLVVPEGVLWSFLDPLQAGAFIPDPSSDRMEVETGLRHERRRFQARLHWWQGTARGQGEALRGILRGFRPDLTGLLDGLDRCHLPAGEGTARLTPTGAGPALSAPEPGLPGAEPTGARDLPGDDPDAVYAWLADPRGLGALYGPGFAPRPEQADMGRQVALALAGPYALAIEAGTGVGKTLAYLTPLLAAVMGRQSRAVISTHTRALQRQILDQDFPRLQSVFPGRSAALLMGRRNYLCLRQRQEFLTRPLADLKDALQAAAFRLWLLATASGLREELAGHPLLGSEVRALFDAAELCLPGMCYEGDRCFVQAARRRARAADLVVVNHALLLHDLKAGNTLLGEFDHLVVDEAHRLPEVALDTHTLACGTWRLAEIEDLLGSWGAKGGLPARVTLACRRLEALGMAGEKAGAAAEEFGRAARRAADAFQVWWSVVGAQLGGPGPQGESPQIRVRVRDKVEAFGLTRAECARCLEELACAATACARMAGLAGGLDDLPDATQDDLAQLAQAGQLCGLLQQDIRFLTEDPDEQWVTWLESGSRHGLKALGATPLESGPLLREYWADRGRHPVMTSATLAVGEDFTHMLQELGLQRLRPPAVTHASPSPFDFHRQTLILTPGRFLAPDAPGFGAAVGEILRELALRIGRKTMGLFTSYRQLREAAAALAAGGVLPPGRGTIPGRPVLLEQGQGSEAAALLEGFRRQKRAVLLGTSTFWEGVDFPGTDLEILVLAKLPFLVPNDPWVEARCERVAALGENPFTDFMVRDAVLRLKQGFGRLIRRPTDRGVVLILDTRLHTKNYGTTFLNALPVIPRTFGDTQELLDRVEQFFGRA